MKAIFGILSLVVVLAVVGLLAKTQLRAVDGGFGPRPSDPASQAATAGASGLTVAGQAGSIEQKARDDIARALQQGTERNAEADR